MNRAHLDKLFTVLLAGVLAGLVLAARRAAGRPARSGRSPRRPRGRTRSCPQRCAPRAQPAQRSYLYANDGKTLITTFYDENRTDVPLSGGRSGDAAGDRRGRGRRFYQHGGVDLRGVARALVANVRGGGTGRARSTLTMQYVRNVLKTDPTRTAEERGPRPRTPSAARSRRSGTRPRWRRSSARTRSSDRYLNIAYFGSGAYGIAAASQRYFGKAPAEADPGRGGPARRPGAVARRVQPDQRRRRPGAVAPAGVRARLDGRHRRDHRGAGRRGQGGEAHAATRAARRTAAPLSPSRAQRLGLLLRLLPPVVDGAAGVRHDRQRARAGAAPRRLHRSSPRSTRRSSDGAAAGDRRLRVRQQAGPADRGGRAGHRPGAGHGGEPELQRGGEPGRAAATTRTPSTR